MRKSYREENGEKVFRYSIRKCHFGAASVAVAALMFFANGAVKADTLPVSSATANTEKVNDGVTELTEGVSTGLKDTIEPKAATEPKAAIEPKADTEGLPTGLKNNIESKVETEPKAVTEGVSTGLKDNIEPKAATESKAATEGVLTGLKDNVESKVQTTGLQEKVSALQSEVNRIRANEKYKSQIEQAEKLIEEAKDLQASKTVTQKEVDIKVKEIKSLTFILKSMKAEETVKPKKNSDSRNDKKMQEGTGFRMGEGTTESTPSTPQPEGNVIARGEDGVPWELYENGYLLFKPEVGKDTLTNNSGKSTWKINYGVQIKHVGFADKVYAPENSESLFAEITLNANSTIYTNFNPLTFDTIHLDTSKVTNMSKMFDGLGRLTNLDVTHFDTRNVTNMSRMFNFMFNLTNLDLTHFDTSKVTNMSSMFSHMEKLTNLDLTHFDTSKVTDMSWMFRMNKLTNLDLTHFNTSNVTNMSGMFGGMSKLTNLDVTHFDTSNVTNMSAMFRNMYITNLDLTHFNTSNVTNMSAMFSESSELTNLDVTHFNTSNVTNMSGMFNGMSNITNLDVTHFDTGNVTDMSEMFSGMSNLTNLDLTNFDTREVTDMEDMFYDSDKLKELKLGDKFNADGIRSIPTTHSYGNQYTDKWHKVENKEHTYTVSEWADAYAGNSTATAGTWVREVSNATLTFQGENFTPVKVAPSDTALPTLSRPSQPKQNHKFLGWSKDGTNLLTRDAVKPGETITLQPLWQPVNNTTTRTAVIPIATTYRADETIPFESRQEVAGREGEKTITTTYTVAPYTGELTNPVESERVTTEMQPKVIKVGNKKVTTEPILVTNKYVGNEEKDRGYSNLKTQGQDGLRTITTTYTVNETTGNLSDPINSETSTPMTQNVYEVGTKPKVFYGKEGNKVVKTTTTYVVDPTNGNVTEASAKETISEDGAKDKVVYSKDGNKVVKTTTTYNVNPDTGAVSEAGTTKETISEDGAKDNVVYSKEGNKVVKSTTTYNVNPDTGAVSEAGTTKETISEDGAKDKVVYSKDGNKVVKSTTTYNVNPDTGAVTEAGTTKETISEDGAKDKVVYSKDGNKVVKSTTTYNVNPDTGAVSEAGTTKETISEDGAKDKVVYSKEGNKVVKSTTTYNVNPDSGAVSEAGTTKETISEDGAKDKVVYSKEGNKIVKSTTTYNVNPDTGAVSEAGTTKETISEDGAKDNAVTPAAKTKVANPDSLTSEEKKAIENKVRAVNPEAKSVVVDDQGNATVTLPNGNTAVIPASDLTKSAKDVNDGKAKDNAVTPASKTKVANPEKLTDAEKKAIEDKVKAANPGATVVVDDKGNATVVKDGNVSVIPSTDLVKVEDDATKPNGGNDANTPAAKTVVADPTKLTDEEKAAVKKAVAAVNPDSTVVVDDQGNATVTKGDGTVLNIPASDLVIPAEKLADEAKTAKVKIPAIRTLVGNKENLTKDEKDAVKKSIEAVNPGATVVVDDQGNATVTMPNGSTATISKEQLVKDKEAISKSKHGGDNLDIDWSKVEVADLANITPEEKAKFQFKVLGVITDVEEFDLDAYIKSTDKDGNTVYTSKDSKVKITIDKDGNATVEKDGKKELAINIDKAGNVTIVTKEGQVLAIPRDDAFKQRPYVPSNGGGNNGATNTDVKVDKAKLEGAIHQLDELFIQESAKLDAETAKEATDLLADAKKVFANADASQAEVDAMVKRLEEFKLNQASVATDDRAANNATNASNGETSEDAADAKLAANVSKRNSQKELPNTGTSISGTVLPAIAALLLGVGVFATKKKEDE